MHKKMTANFESLMVNVERICAELQKTKKAADAHLKDQVARIDKVIEPMQADINVLQVARSKWRSDDLVR
jgi:hypothetical protein